MEKKNTILLTVIAIATLLVAVVGATFAYFTATVTTDKDKEGNNTTNVTAYALTEAKMEMGSKVTANGVYPGYKAVKSVAIKGKCPEGNASCEDVNTVITITPDIASEFGSDVTWKLYKSNAEAVTCTTVPVTDGGHYYDAGECTIPSGATIEASGSTEEVTKDVVVSGYTDSKKNKTKTDDTYYLVVEYANNTEGPQNGQGKSFSVAIDFASK